MLTNEGDFREEPSKEQLEQYGRLEAAKELDAILAKLQSLTIQNRVMAIVKTKLEEAILWYARLLREEDGK